MMRAKVREFVARAASRFRGFAGGCESDVGGKVLGGSSARRSGKVGAVPEHVKVCSSCSGTSLPKPSGSPSNVKSGSGTPQNKHSSPKSKRSSSTYVNEVVDKSPKRDFAQQKLKSSPKMKSKKVQSSSLSPKAKRSLSPVLNEVGETEDASGKAGLPNCKEYPSIGKAKSKSSPTKEAKAKDCSTRSPRAKRNISSDQAGQTQDTEEKVGVPESTHLLPNCEKSRSVSKAKSKSSPTKDSPSAKAKVSSTGSPRAKRNIAPDATEVVETEEAAEKVSFSKCTSRKSPCKAKSRCSPGKKSPTAKPKGRPTRDSPNRNEVQESPVKPKKMNSPCNGNQKHSPPVLNPNESPAIRKSKSASSVIQEYTEIAEGHVKLGKRVASVFKDTALVVGSIATAATVMKNKFEDILDATKDMKHAYERFKLGDNQGGGEAFSEEAETVLSSETDNKTDPAEATPVEGAESETSVEHEKDEASAVKGEDAKADQGHENGGEDPDGCDPEEDLDGLDNGGVEDSDGCDPEEDLDGADQGQTWWEAVKEYIFGG